VSSRSDIHPRLGQRSVVAAAIVLGLVAILAATLAVHHAARVRAERRRTHDGALLRARLETLRLALARYNQRHHGYPHALDELVTGGDLRAIPVDPLTGSAESWKTATEERVQVDDFRAGSTAPATVIFDVRSGAPSSDAAGKPWADY
jgi:general secretion pathway protein G